MTESAIEKESVWMWESVRERVFIFVIEFIWDKDEKERKRGKMLVSERKCVSVSENVVFERVLYIQYVPQTIFVV